MNYGYVIVGAGFSGAVFAERAANDGKRVLLIEQRDHVGGNCYDYVDENGILVHKYGPHAFHTNHKIVWDYLSQFTEWVPYKHKVTALVDGKIVTLPVNLETISQLFDEPLSSLYTEKLLKSFKKGEKLHIMELLRSEDPGLRDIANTIYEKVYLTYSRKQWGIDPRELDPSVLNRVPLWLDYEPYYFKDTYQAMPKEGYTALIEKLLNNSKIEVVLGKDYKQIIGNLDYKTLVYTGPIDYFFDSKYDLLPYRSLRFEFEIHDTEYFQKATTVNYPGKEPFTRITEFKHFNRPKTSRTTIAIEYPEAHDRSRNLPFYPIPKKENYTTYEKYLNLAKKEKNVIFIGRLAEYRYYNMDEAILRALQAYEKSSISLN